MALTGPVGSTNLDISFRLQCKTEVFNATSNPLTNTKLNILTAASSYGLVFTGSNLPELVVLCAKHIESPEKTPVRKVPLPSPALQIATNCDGSILAVEVKINGVPHIQLYSVPSFLTPNVQKLREFRISADNSESSQICWNPVINNILAVCTVSGCLNLYTLKDNGIEFNGIDLSLKAKCCCWSPKGKQIVAGFSSGKLMQFNMELKPARTIECPPNIMSGNFDTIAVQWLSTYQFAIILASQQEESRPVFHILNAPKAGPLQYIAYNDVCYSTSEQRPSKIYIQYIQQWSMILVASANCIDVSLLRISKTGDVPEWTQEYSHDTYPAELPLAKDTSETFPIGFELDTASTSCLQNEDGTSYPVMPMLHILSTHGCLCSFYILNTTKTFVDICSPPRPLDNNSMSLFKVPVTQASDEFTTPPKATVSPISHSTPALPKTNLFETSAPPALTAVNNQATSFTGFSMPFSQPQQQIQPPPPPQAQTQQPAPSLQFGAKPANVPQTIAPTVQPSKPLITVPPTYNPPSGQEKKSEPKDVKLTSGEKQPSEPEDESVYIKMIQDEIKAFELEFKVVMEKSKSLRVNIGTKEESAEMRRNLEDLDELKKEATETIDSLRSEVQVTRLGLYELFSIFYEAKAKCENADKEISNFLNSNQVQDRSSKRTIEKLRRMIDQSEMQLQIAIQLLNSQWSNYQEAQSKNKKNKMHVPSLEALYQTLSKQQEIVYNLGAKITLLKSKLGITDDVKKQRNVNISANIESLSDSIISMSLIDQVQTEQEKLSEKKIKNLRNYLSTREVVTIKPQRPKLPGLNSEIIIEKKKNAIKSMKKPVPKAPTAVPVSKQTAGFTKPLNKPTEITKPQMSQIPTTVPTISSSFKTQAPTESVFSVLTTNQSGQKTSPFMPVSSAPVATSQAATPLFGKKTEEITKPSFSFGNNFQSGLNLSLSGSTLPQPSFGSGFSSTPLILNAEKKKEETLPKPVAETPKQAPIANVTANFSLPKPTAVPKEIPKVEEKKEEVKTPPTTNETVSFTFSLPGKKETPKPAATTTPIFSSLSSAATFSTPDSTKSSFSFAPLNANNASFSFGSTPKPASDVKTSDSVSIFNTPSAATNASSTSGSIFGSSSSFAFNLSNTATKTPVSITKIEEPKVTVSIPLLTPTSPIAVTTASNLPATTTTVTSSASDIKSSFSFASLGGSLQITPQPQATTESTTANVSSSTDSVLQGLSICAPENTKSPESSTNKNIFSSVNADSLKTETSSLFGGNNFASAFETNTTKSSLFGQTSPTTSSVFSTPVSSTTVTTTAANSSIFGSLAIDSSKTTGSVFGSGLVKPDQSVFGQNAAAQSSPPTTTTTSGFSSLFSPTNSQSSTFGSNVFATSQPQPSTNLFAQAQQPQSQPQNAFQGSGSIFSQGSFSSAATNTSTNTNIFGAAAQSPFSGTSIFGSGGSSTQASGSSIFGAQNTSGGGNVFGGGALGSGTGSLFSSAQNQPTFGGSATFGSAFNQSTFGGGSSIFNQQAPTFGGGATFQGSPKANLFGSAAPTSPSGQSSSSLFEQLGQQQSGNLFGNLAQQQQPPQQQGAFQGSAFSSWR